MPEIGVIADTHGLLRPEALAALAGCDLILHAGDVGKPEVLESLRAIAPLRIVRGNVDRGDWAEQLPETVCFQIDGVWFYLIHNINELDVTPEFACRVLVFGHSHKPCNEMRQGILYFNPGSAGPRRFRLPIAVGRLSVDAGHVEARVLTLTP